MSATGIMSRRRTMRNYVYAEEDRYVPKAEVLDHPVGHGMYVAAFRSNCLRAGAGTAARKG